MQIPALSHRGKAIDARHPVLVEQRSPQANHISEAQEARADADGETA